MGDQGLWDKSMKQEPELEEKEEHDNESKCPECGEPIIALWSGVKCSHCDWWFCY